MKPSAIALSSAALAFSLGAAGAEDQRMQVER